MFAVFVVILPVRAVRIIILLGLIVLLICVGTNGLFTRLVSIVFFVRLLFTTGALNGWSESSLSVMR